jgi:hypothetical protein
MSGGGSLLLPLWYCGSCCCRRWGRSASLLRLGWVLFAVDVFLVCMLVVSLLTDLTLRCRLSPDCEDIGLIDGTCWIVLRCCEVSQLSQFLDETPLVASEWTILVPGLRLRRALLSLIGRCFVGSLLSLLLLPVCDWRRDVCLLNVASVWIRLVPTEDFCVTRLLLAIGVLDVLPFVLSSGLLTSTFKKRDRSASLVLKEFPAKYETSLLHVNTKWVLARVIAT